jgi:hypothetical protein
LKLSLDSSESPGLQRPGAWPGQPGNSCLEADCSFRVTWGQGTPSGACERVFTLLSLDSTVLGASAPGSPGLEALLRAAQTRPEITVQGHKPAGCAPAAPPAAGIRPLHACRLSFPVRGAEDGGLQAQASFQTAGAAAAASTTDQRFLPRSSRLCGRCHLPFAGDSRVTMTNVPLPWASGGGARAPGTMCPNNAPCPTLLWPGRLSPPWKEVGYR